MRIFALLILLFFSSPAFAVFTVDGATSATVTSNISITTKAKSELIILFSFNSSSTGTITSISDAAGLTWTKRIAVNQASQLVTEEWYAIAPAKLSSDLITPVWSAGNGSRLTVFGIIGADNVTPFDANGSLPASQQNASSQSASVTISTNNANVMLITFLRGLTTLGTVTPPSGFSQIVSTGTNQDDSYKILTATLSSAAQSYTWTGAATHNNLIVDAVRESSSALTNMMTDTGF